MSIIAKTCDSLRAFGAAHPEKFGAVLIDPPWRFLNRTGKVAPEHRRLARYPMLSLAELEQLPVAELADERSHLYLWCPNALLADGLRLMQSWGFTYKTNIVWYKVRKDGGPDGRGVGFYFRNVTELVLFGVRGKLRTLAPGRRQTNIIVQRKREHSRKPPTLHTIVSQCSPGPFVELFSRERVEGWQHWGDQVDSYVPRRSTHRGYSWDPPKSVVTPPPFAFRGCARQPVSFPESGSDEGSPRNVIFGSLRQMGYDVHCRFHADSILGDAFPEVVLEVEKILSGLQIPVSELIRGGGGEAKVTQRLRRTLADRGWNKGRSRSRRGSTNGRPSRRPTRSTTFG